MKKITLILLLLPIINFAQVLIPDVNFETELIAQGIDTDGVVNGQISTTDALATTGTLDLNGKNISDLTGIEAFTNITKLQCEDNNLTSINFPTLINLTQLRCKNNSLTTLDVSGNTALIFLTFQNNNVSVLDISNNTALSTIYATSNQLTNLNTSSNTNLTTLYCANNLLSSIDLSTNINLTNLRIHGNNLADLDLTSNTSLTELYCQNNNLDCIKVNDVAYADANFNKDASAIFSTDCTTLSNNSFSLQNSVIIYPNPAQNKISIKAGVVIDTVSLYDLNGRLIFNTNFNETLNIEALKSGVYFLKLRSGNTIISKKIIKT